MNRRYNLQRSDNYPVSGLYAASVSGSGSFNITTGFPVASALVSHAIAYNGKPAVDLFLDGPHTEDIQSSAFNEDMSWTEPVIVQRVEFLFSRHSSLLRQYSISATIGGRLITMAAATASLDKSVMVDNSTILNVGDTLHLFADIDDSLKSSSSSVSSVSSASTSNSSLSSSLNSSSSSSESSVSSRSSSLNSSSSSSQSVSTPSSRSSSSSSSLGVSVSSASSSSSASSKSSHSQSSMTTSASSKSPSSNSSSSVDTVYVSGAITPDARGAYTANGMYGGKVAYERFDSAFWILFDAGAWIITNSNPPDYAYVWGSSLIGSTPVGDYPTNTNTSGTARVSQVPHSSSSSSASTASSSSPSSVRSSSSTASSASSKSSRSSSASSPSSKSSASSRSSSRSSSSESSGSTLSSVRSSSSSSSTLNSSSSSSSSINSSSSASSASTLSSSSSSASSLNSSSSSVSSLSSASSTGMFRLFWKVYYIPVSLTTPMEGGGGVKAYVDQTGYTSTGFRVLYEGAPSSGVLEVAYLAT